MLYIADNAMYWFFSSDVLLFCRLVIWFAVGSVAFSFCVLFLFVCLFSRAQLEYSKRWGTLSIANQLFKIYFRVRMPENAS